MMETFLRKVSRVKVDSCRIVAVASLDDKIRQLTSQQVARFNRWGDEIHDVYADVGQGSDAWPKLEREDRVGMFSCQMQGGVLPSRPVVIGSPEHELDEIPSLLEPPVAHRSSMTDVEDSGWRGRKVEIDTSFGYQLFQRE